MDQLVEFMLEEAVEVLAEEQEEDLDQVDQEAEVQHHLDLVMQEQLIQVEEAEDQEHLVDQE
jgi:hypothetical protein